VPVSAHAGDGQAQIASIGDAIQRAWNDPSAAEAADLPPIDLTDDERDYLAKAVLRAIRTWPVEERANG
jgi:hypothetical protein